MAIITLVCTYLAGEIRPSAAAELAEATAGN